MAQVSCLQTVLCTYCFHIVIHVVKIDILDLFIRFKVKSTKWSHDILKLCLDYELSYTFKEI